MRIPKELQSELDNCGYPWTLEKGSKHYKVRVSGRLVAILPHGKVQTTDLTALRNSIAQVRRLVRELREKEQ